MPEQVLSDEKQPAEKPFPWRCPKCRQLTVNRVTMPYSCQRTHNGRVVIVDVPNLAVPQCSNCSEVVFDYAADEQIRAALQTLFVPAETTLNKGQEHRFELPARSKNKLAHKETFMPTIGERIVEKALAALEAAPEGLRYSDLVRQVMKLDGSFRQNTVHGNVWNLDERFPDRIYKPSRGLFRLTKFRAPDTDQLKDELIPKQPEKFKEEDFYESFADWLVNEMEECTRAIPLGGNRFRDKWGTPDVIGKRESKRSDIIQAPVEIVSAEIKPDVYQLITAFGQACAYCLFSHKVYLVISNKAPDDEIARIDTLCQVFGLGLVLFDSDNPKDPRFAIRARPRYQQPDLFYANRYMRLIEVELFS